MTTTMFGTVVGLALGASLAFGTFGDMLIVALFGILGFGIAKILAGEVDLTRYISGRRDEQ